MLALDYLYLVILNTVVSKAGDIITFDHTSTKIDHFSKFTHSYILF